MKSPELKQVAKVGAAHLAAIGAMNMITTVFLHRGETLGLRSRQTGTGSGTGGYVAAVRDETP